jgi:hypothetical protein
MYLIWIKCETNKIIRLGVKFGKNTLGQNKCLALNETYLPPKWATSNIRLGEVGFMPLQWPRFAKQKDICIISSDDDFHLLRRKQG